MVTAIAAVPASLAYRVARQMERMPEWASGLARGVDQEGGVWYADSPMGRVRVDMTPENPWGVLDHDVTLPSGEVVSNVFRVTPVDHDRCLFSFVMVRRPGTSQEAFEADIAHVEKDLCALRELLEDKVDEERMNARRGTASSLTSGVRQA